MFYVLFKEYVYAMFMWTTQKDSRHLTVVRKSHRHNEHGKVFEQQAHLGERARGRETEQE